jgi:hypothetical protein
MAAAKTGAELSFGNAAMAAVVRAPPAGLLLVLVLRLAGKHGPGKQEQNSRT